MSELEFKTEIKRVAAGFSGNVEINRHLSYVAVSDFFMQGELAVEMIEDIEKLIEKYGVTETEAAIFLVDVM